MSIAWSSWRYAGGNGMRIGIETSVSSVSHSSSSCTITWKVYTQNQYQYLDNGQEINWSGNLTGQTTYDNRQGAGSVTLRATRTTTHTYSGSSYGSSPGKHTVTAAIGYTYNGVHPSKTVSVAIPARPFAGPSAPSGVSELRETDYRARISWTNNRTAGRPWDNVVVQRQELGGSWRTVATLSGSASSWTDTGIHADSSYRWRVYSRNRVGSSGNVYTRTLWTTPATPKDVRTSLLSGNRVRIRWGSTVDYPSSEYTFDIERRDSNGTTWSRVIWGEPGSTRETIDSSPLAGENQYRIRTAHWESGRADQQMQSAWVYAPVISTMVPPKAPTQLAPNGTNPAFDARGPQNSDQSPLVLTWQHNDGGDGADQELANIQTSADNGVSWDMLVYNIAAGSRYEVPANALSNGVTYLWRVVTKGLSPTWGPWSSPATVRMSTTPTVDVTGPVTPVTELPVVVTWDYAQAEGVAQGIWEVRLYRDGHEVRFWQEFSSAASFDMSDFPFEDGVTYEIGVKVRSDAGLWSDESFTTFVVDLLPPAPVSLDAEFDPESGAAVLTMHADDPADVGVVDRQNWAPNPSFESGLDQGDLVHATAMNATVAWDDAWSAVGTNSVRIDPIEDGNSDTTFYPFGSDASAVASALQWLPGTTVTVGATIHLSEAQTGGLWSHARRIRINMHDGERTTWDWALSDPAPNTPGDHRVQVTFTVPQEARGMHMCLCNGSNTVPVWWDALTVELGATDGTYFDGDTVGASWLGVPHESRSVIVEPGTGAPPSEATAAVDHVDVQRRIDGSPWVTIHAGLQFDDAADLTVLDTAPTILGLNEYRLIVTSVSPSSEVGEPVELPVHGCDSTRWSFLSYGPGFTTVLRGTLNASVSEVRDRTRAIVPVLGRRKPLLLVGAQTSRDRDIALTLQWGGYGGDSSTGDEFLQAAEDAGVVLWRDQTGSRIFGRLSAVTAQKVLMNRDQVAFTVTEVAYDEDVS